MIIESHSSKLDYRPLSSDVIYYQRDSVIDKETTIRDVFPYCWAVAAGSSSNKISLTYNGNEHHFEGNNLVFLPINCTVQWSLKPQDLSFGALLCNLPMPKHLPKTPTFVKNDQLDQSTIKVIEGILTGEDVSRFQIENWALWLENLATDIVFHSDLSESQETNLAMRFKERIDVDFNKDVAIKDLAEEMNVSHSYLIRSFKDHYGLTPVEYRKRCRVYFMMYKILFEKAKVVDAGADAGFNDQSHMYRYFKSILGFTPKKFNP